MFSTILATTFLLASTLGPARPLFHSAPHHMRTAAYTLRLASDTTEPASGVELTTDEREFIDRINADRTERGLYALTPDQTLVQAARGHSWDMSVQGYFSHIAPDAGQRTPLDRYLSDLHTDGLSTPGYLMIGENIFYCSVRRAGRDVRLGHQALMNSPGHRANILNPRYDRVGVGIFRDGSGQFWVTEMFLGDGVG